MFEGLKKFLKDVFTEDDNESADLIPIAAFGGMATFLGLSIYMVVIKAVPFNGTDFGIGFSTMLTCLGVAFKLKRDAQTKPLAEAPVVP